MPVSELTSEPADEPGLAEAVRRCFHHTYAAAKTAFMQAAVAAEARLESLTCPAPGPRGEALTIDAAYVGPADSRKLLVVTSGVHGVEGYAGAAIQLDALNATWPAADVALLLVHFVNPFGVAWSGSNNEDNVDLNRNFVSFQEPLEENVLYNEVDDFVCCPELVGPLRDAADARMASYIDKYGLERLVRAVCDGQYHRPGRFNFGGVGPAWSNLALRSLLNRFAHSATHIGVIDVHTGLGDRGASAMLCIEPPDEAAAARAQSWWPDTLVVPSTAFPFAPRGTFVGSAWHLNPQQEVTAAALEVGTEPPERVFAALRNRFWLSIVAAAPADVVTNIDDEIHACLAPRDDAWRMAALLSGRRAIRRAVQGLSGR